MIISEKQIMQLIKIADHYANTIAQMISNGNGYGDLEGLIISIRRLLCDIQEQQSEELR